MEIAELVFGIVGATLVLLACLFFVYIVFAYWFKQNDVEKDYLDSLDDDKRTIIYNYLLARKIKFKDLFSKRKDK